MKRKIIVVATVFVVALVAAYGVYNNQNKNALADLMLDNVEALAQGEVIVGPWYCAGEFNVCFHDSQGIILGLKY